MTAFSKTIFGKILGGTVDVVADVVGAVAGQPNLGNTVENDINKTLNSLFTPGQTGGTTSTVSTITISTLLIPLLLIGAVVVVIVLLTRRRRKRK